MDHTTTGLLSNHSKEPVRVVIRTGGEEQLIRLPVVGITSAEGEPPQSVDADDFAAGISQLADELAVARAVSIDSAVRQVSD